MCVKTNPVVLPNRKVEAEKIYNALTIWYSSYKHSLSQHSTTICAMSPLPPARELRNLHAPIYHSRFTQTYSARQMETSKRV